MKRQKFLSLVGLGSAGLFFKPCIEFFKKKSSAVLVVSYGDQPIINDYFTENNIEYYYMDANTTGLEEYDMLGFDADIREAEKEVPADPKHIIYGKPINTLKWRHEIDWVTKNSIMALGNAARDSRDYFLKFFDSLKNKKAITDLILFVSQGSSIQANLEIASIAKEKGLIIHSFIIYPFSNEYCDDEQESFTCFKETLQEIEKLSDSMFKFDPENEYIKRYGKNSHYEELCYFRKEDIWEAYAVHIKPKISSF